MRVIELKTARLFEAGCRLGAITAERDGAVQQQLHDYGHHLGLAFQLVDDVLDYTADSEVSGKNVGTDLAEGKPTLPLIHAMKHGSKDETALIRDAIMHRSEERRVGKECVSTCRSRGSRYL